jgi:hypothetical protein
MQYDHALQRQWATEEPENIDYPEAWGPRNAPGSVSGRYDVRRRPPLLPGRSNGIGIVCNPAFGHLIDELHACFVFLLARLFWRGLDLLFGWLMGGFVIHALSSKGRTSSSFPFDRRQSQQLHEKIFSLRKLNCALGTIDAPTAK